MGILDSSPCKTVQMLDFTVRKARISGDVQGADAFEARQASKGFEVTVLEYVQLSLYGSQTAQAVEVAERVVVGDFEVPRYVRQSVQAREFLEPRKFAECQSSPDFGHGLKSLDRLQIRVESDRQVLSGAGNTLESIQRREFIRADHKASTHLRERFQATQVL